MPAFLLEYHINTLYLTVKKCFCSNCSKNIKEILVKTKPMPQFCLGYYAMTLQTSSENVVRCLGGGLWLSCHGDLLATEENTTSSVATFMAPTLQLLIGVVFNNRKYENLASNEMMRVKLPPEEDCKADILYLSLSSFAPTKSEQCEHQLCNKLLVWW